MDIAEYERLLIPFHRTVLCHYRASPDLYRLQEDDMGGSLKTVHDGGTQQDASAINPPWFQVRFGFRRLEDGRVCVAAFGPDLKKLPEKEQLIWRGHLIERPQFAKSDPAFLRWVSRNLDGSWEVEDGPKVQIEGLVRLIRALTHQALGVSLWRDQWNPLINYPVAENTEAYTKAHLELYRVLIDGLNQEALSALSRRLNRPLSDPSKTLNGLKELLPEDMIPKIHQPLKDCYEKRQKSHGVPSITAHPFPAFDIFHRDLVATESCLRSLDNWLQSMLSADSESCLQREESMSTVFPQFGWTPNTRVKVGRASEGNRQNG
jgi:hypothetical protein